LNFWLEVADGDAAHLREERTVNWHSYVKAEGYTEGFEEYFSHAETLRHQSGFCESEVEDGRHKEHRDDINNARNDRFLYAVLAAFYEYPSSSQSLNLSLLFHQPSPSLSLPPR